MKLKNEFEFEYEKKQQVQQCTILIRLKGKYCLNDEKGGTGAKE